MDGGQLRPSEHVFTPDYWGVVRAFEADRAWGQPAKLSNRRSTESRLGEMIFDIVSERQNLLPLVDGMSFYFQPPQGEIARPYYTEVGTVLVIDDERMTFRSPRLAVDQPSVAEVREPTNEYLRDAIVTQDALELVRDQVSVVGSRTGFAGSVMKFLTDGDKQYRRKVDIAIVADTSQGRQLRGGGRGVFERKPSGRVKCLHSLDVLSAHVPFTIGQTDESHSDNIKQWSRIRGVWLPS